MSHSSYTASERRGILAIALISLVILGAGLAASFWNVSTPSESQPMVVIHDDYLDSVAIKSERESVLKSAKSKSSKKTESGKKNSKKNATKKSIRKRSPLDEPV